MMGGWGFVSSPSSGRGLVVFPHTISKSRTSQRCPRNCSGVLAVTFLEGAQGLLSRFVRVYPVFRLHHSRGRRGCSGPLAGWWWHHSRRRRDCSRVLTLVYSGYITQGGAGGALVGCHGPTAQVLLFPYTHCLLHSAFSYVSLNGTMVTGGHAVCFIAHFHTFLPRPSAAWATAGSGISHRLSLPRTRMAILTLFRGKRAPLTGAAA